MRTTAEVFDELVGRGMTRAELAARLGVPRETVSRWASGVHETSLTTLHRAAAAAGYQLELTLHPAEPKLVALVEDQLDLGRTERLQALLGDDWPQVRDGLRVAAQLRDLVTVIGPVAAALVGAPQRPAARVDLLVLPEDREQLHDRLFDLGVAPDGTEQAAAGAHGERRERWSTRMGAITIRDRLSGVDDLRLLKERARALPAVLNGDDVGIIHPALAEDLAEISLASPWSEDAIYLPGLRAVLACGRYRSREAADRNRAAARETLQLA